MLKIINLNNQLVIGEYLEVEGNNGTRRRMILKSPRFLLAREKDGMSMWQFVELVGKPQEIEIFSTALIFSYEVADAEVKNKYTEITTGLVMPNIKGPIIPFDIGKKN